MTLNNKSLLYPSHLLSVITNLTEPRGPPQPADLFCFGKQGSREGSSSPQRCRMLSVLTPEGKELYGRNWRVGWDFRMAGLF